MQTVTHHCNSGRNEYLISIVAARKTHIRHYNQFSYRNKTVMLRQYNSNKSSVIRSGLTTQ